MSEITNEELIGQNTDRVINKMRGLWHKHKHFQSAAADSVADVMGQAEFTGEIGDFYVTFKAAPASGESMTIDLLVDGTSVLLSGTPVTINSTSGFDFTKQLCLFDYIDPDKRSVTIGSVYTVTRDYTAGGGPTPMGANTVTVEHTQGKYQGA